MSEHAHVCSVLFAEVVPQRLLVFESPVYQHHGRGVIPAQQKALVGRYSPGNAAQPPIPNQNGWETERPANFKHSTPNLYLLFDNNTNFYSNTFIMILIFILILL